MTMVRITLVSTIPAPKHYLTLGGEQLTEDETHNGFAEKQECAQDHVEVDLQDKESTGIDGKRFFCSVLGARDAETRHE